MRKANLLVAALAFLLGKANLTWANLIVNGGFESYTTSGLPYDKLAGNGLFTTFYGPPNTASNTEITGWTITGQSGGNPNNLDLVSSVEWPAFAGNESVDISGDTGAAGVIEQLFSTVTGQEYNLSLEYCNNPDGSGASMAISVMGNGALLSGTVSHNGSTRANMGYHLYSSNFIADSNATTLQFSSITNSGTGIVLDAVSIVSVPEPGSLGLLAVAGAFLAFRSRPKSVCS